LQTYCDPAKRLELSFRQKDVGCRPLFGNRQTCKGLLLRVRRRRCSNHTALGIQQRTNGTAEQTASEKLQSTSSSTSMFQYSAEVIGMVDTVYRFQSQLVSFFIRTCFVSSVMLNSTDWPTHFSYLHPCQPCAGKAHCVSGIHVCALHKKI